VKIVPSSSKLFVFLFLSNNMFNLSVSSCTDFIFIGELISLTNSISEPVFSRVGFMKLQIIATATIAKMIIITPVTISLSPLLFISLLDNLCI